MHQIGCVLFTESAHFIYIFAYFSICAQENDHNDDGGGDGSEERT